MASTFSITAKTVFGNKRIIYGTFTATDGTDMVASGLRKIDHVQCTVKTAANNSGVHVSGGNFELTTGTSAGTYHIMVIGN